MNVSVIISILIVIEGIYSIITGRLIGNNQRTLEKYTEASYTKYCRIVGVIFIVIGAILCVIDLMQDSGDNLEFILLGVCVIALIIILVLRKVVLVKNGSAKGKGGSDRYIDED